MYYLDYGIDCDTGYGTIETTFFFNLRSMLNYKQLGSRCPMFPFSKIYQRSRLYYSLILFSCHFNTGNCYTKKKACIVSYRTKNVSREDFTETHSQPNQTQSNTFTTQSNTIKHIHNPIKHLR